ncbi:MAG: DNA primase [Patescibacteria group bacterium]|nr:DNA primase [Patescibacteria group bacterium]MCL5093688.1 DNA primase [Patescibacteria group bacterium]
MNELEQIKEKLDIVEVVNGYLPLKQSGRNFKACCPFHTEKTPSFMVSAEKQIWHCFGCNEGGDVFSFVMKMEGLDFPSVLKILAEKAGVTLQKQSENYGKDKERKAKLFEINEMASEYFEKMLFSKEGEAALDYLKKRKLTTEIIKDFRIGFAPYRNNTLLDDLRKIGFSDQEIAAAGVGKVKDSKVVNQFIERITFPISDHSGSIVGFSARVLDDSLPKYLNTPETEIYHKSNILFGMDKAKSAIRKLDHAIIVEGNMDVVASHQVGVKNAIATSGTALTEHQLNLLKRFTSNLKLAFDIDSAGSEATKRAIDEAMKMGFNLKVIEIPEGKDPADAALKDKKIWAYACKRAKYVIDYLFDKSFSKHNRETALGKKEIAKELLGVIKRIPEEIEQEHYLKKLSLDLGTSEQILKEALDRSKNAANLPDREKPTPKEKADIGLLLEERIAGFAAVFPDFRNYILRNLKSRYLKNDLVKEIVGKIKEYKKGFKKELTKEAKNILNIIELKIEEEFADFTNEDLEEEIIFCLKRLKSIRLGEEKKEIEKKMVETEKKDIKIHKELLTKLNTIIKEQEIN